MTGYLSLLDNIAICIADYTMTTADAVQLRTMQLKRHEPMDITLILMLPLVLVYSPVSFPFRRLTRIVAFMGGNSFGPTQEFTGRSCSGSIS